MTCEMFQGSKPFAAALSENLSSKDWREQRPNWEGGTERQRWMRLRRAMGRIGVAEMIRGPSTPTTCIPDSAVVAPRHD